LGIDDEMLNSRQVQGPFLGRVHGKRIIKPIVFIHE
jgi:hypothetical protein